MQAYDESIDKKSADITESMDVLSQSNKNNAQSNPAEKATNDQQQPAPEAQVHKPVGQFLFLLAVIIFLGVIMTAICAFIITCCVRA